MSKAKLVEDILIRNPVLAEPWHLVAHVRQVMLANSFSNLPILWDGKWQVLTDIAVMQFLKGDKEIKERQSSTIQAAIENELFKPGVAVQVLPSVTIELLVANIGKRRALVVEEKESQPRLLGILMPFDLL